MRLSDWDPRHLASLPISELTLPPDSSDPETNDQAAQLLTHPAIQQRSRSSLVALHNASAQAAYSGHLVGWTALRRLRLVAQSTLQEGVPLEELPPLALPASLRELGIELGRCVAFTFNLRPPVPVPATSTMLPAFPMMRQYAAQPLPAACCAPTTVLNSPCMPWTTAGTLRRTPCSLNSMCHCGSTALPCDLSITLCWAGRSWADC